MFPRWALATLSHMFFWGGKTKNDLAKTNTGKNVANFVLGVGGGNIVVVLFFFVCVCVFVFFFLLCSRGKDLKAFLMQMHMILV